MSNLLHSHFSDYAALLMSGIAALVLLRYKSKLFMAFALVALGLLIDIVAEQQLLPSIASTGLKCVSLAVMLAGIFMWWKQLVKTKN